MIEAFELISKSMPNVKLVIGGGDHPQMPGYVASVAKRYETTRGWSSRDM